MGIFILSSLWAPVSTTFLLLPLGIVTALLVPWPVQTRQKVLTITNSLLQTEVVRYKQTSDKLMALQVRHIMFLLNGILFAVAAVNMYLSSRKVGALDPNASVSAQSAAWSQRWRAERNAWVSFFSFYLWCILIRIHNELVRSTEAEGHAVDRNYPSEAVAYDAYNAVKGAAKDVSGKAQGAAANATDTARGAAGNANDTFRGAAAGAGTKLREIAAQTGAEIQSRAEGAQAAAQKKGV